MRPFLDEAFAEAPDGAVYVVHGLVPEKNREGMLGKNLGKPFQRIIEQAGHKPWPKLFQNLRVTRENELERDHPSHVVQDWIGHSAKVAKDHYLTVTDQDFQKALLPADDKAKRGQIVVSNPMPQTAKGHGKMPSTSGLQSSAALRNSSQKGQVLPQGLEP